MSARPVTKTCTFLGCETPSTANYCRYVDVENGPSRYDLDDGVDTALCAYHDTELELISHIDLDVLFELGIDPYSLL